MSSLLSDDASRVKLREISGEDGSDYINASYLDVSHTSSVLLCTMTLSNQLFLSGIQEAQSLHWSSR